MIFLEWFRELTVILFSRWLDMWIDCGPSLDGIHNWYHCGFWIGRHSSFFLCVARGCEGVTSRILFMYIVRGGDYITSRFYCYFFRSDADLMLLISLFRCSKTLTEKSCIFTTIVHWMMLYSMMAIRCRLIGFCSLDVARRIPVCADSFT